MKKKIHLSNLIIYFFCCLSLLLSFYLNEDGSYLPFSGDFRDTWPYVLKLNLFFSFFIMLTSNYNATEFKISKKSNFKYIKIKIFSIDGFTISSCDIKQYYLIY